MRRTRLHQSHSELIVGCAVLIAVALGIVFPTVLGATYGDIVGGFIYPGLVARLLSAFRRLLWNTNGGNISD